MAARIKCNLGEGRNKADPIDPRTRCVTKRGIFRTWATVAATVGALQCSGPDGLGGPDVPIFGAVAVNPVFEVSGAEVVDIVAIHLRIRRRANSATVLDSTFSVAADTIIEFAVRVRLVRDPEDFLVDVAFTGPEGDTVFVAGPQVVTATATTIGQTLAPVEMQLRYVGPGSNARTVTVLVTGEEGFVVVPGETAFFTAEAFDSAGAPVPIAPVLWRSLDTTLATVPDLEEGIVVAGANEGNVSIEARLLTGGADTVLLQIRRPPPILTITPDSVHFQRALGEAEPPNAIVDITNDGQAGSILGDLTVGPVSYDGASAGWLTTAALDTTAAPAQLTLGVSGEALAPGTYTASVPIMGPGASNSPRNLRVSFTLLGATSVAVTPAADTLNALGDTTRLTATPLDAAGQPVSGQPITWSSTTPGNATVDSSGLVTSTGNGPATIEARSGSAVGQAEIWVQQVTDTVIVSPNTVAFTSIGDTTTLQATALDPNGNIVAPRMGMPLPIAWTSNAPGRVAVDANGRVSALANTPPDSAALITATIEGVAGTATVTVVQGAASVTIDPQTASLNLGAMLAVSATVADGNGNTLPGAVVTWSSSGLAGTVVSTGPTTATVTASTTEIGPVSIIAAVGALADTLNVTVVPPASVTIMPIPAGATDTLTALGDSLFLVATARDASGQAIPGLNFTWQSSVPIIASVSGMGPDSAAVLARANGNVTVTATTAGGTSGNVVITVRQVPTGGLSVTPTLDTLRSLAETLTLTGVAVDARGQSLPVTWNSASPSVATVTPAGVVTAVGNGTALITLDALGNQATATVVVQQTAVAVEVTPPSATTAAIGDSVLFTARALDSLGSAVPGLVATWLSSDPASASVAVRSDSTALVTALATNTVTVTATMSGISATATLGIGQIPDGPQSTATVPNTGAAGIPTSIVIQSRDASATPLTAGGAIVTAVISGVNNVGGIFVTDSANGRYGASYTPVGLGVDMIAITLNGVPISGSPFTSTIGPGPIDGAVSQASVPAGVAGSLTTVSVQGRDQFGHAVNVGGATVVVTVSGANQQASLPVTDPGDGTYSASYTPILAGADTITVSVNGVALASGPLVSTVAPGPFDPASSTALVPSVATAGLPATLLVQGRDVFGNQVNSGGATLSVVIVAGANTGALVTVADSGTGLYTASYTPLTVGTDQLTIQLDGTPIAGTQPVSIDVVAGGASGAASTATFTPDATTQPSPLVAGTQVRLQVQARDVNGNPITRGGAVAVIDFFAGPNAPQPPISNPVAGVDNEDGTYDYFYTPTIATPLGQGEVDSLAVSLNGFFITGSPFGAHVAPAAIDAAKATVEAVSPDYRSVPSGAGMPVTVTIRARDRFGNALRTGGATLGATLRGANGPQMLPTVDNSDGTYSATYTPIVVGVDSLDLTVNGVVIGDSPVVGTVEPGPPAAVSVQPRGVTLVVGGGGQAFTATVVDQFGNPTTSSPITWASLNPSIAQVDATGFAVAVEAGQVVLRAQAGSALGYTLITVENPASPNPPISSWAPQPSGITDTLLGVWGTSSQSVWAVGTNGTVLHWDGDALTTERTQAGQALFAVWGSSDVDVFAVGPGVVLHNDGAGWSVQQSSAPNLRGVWGSAPNDVWAVGDDGQNGVLYHYNGTSWTSQPSGTLPLRGVWGTAANDIFAVGLSGTILHYDGVLWSPMNSGTSNALFTVWGTSPTNVYAIGEGASARRYNGTEPWTSESVGTVQTDLHGIWGSSDTNVFASGLFGEIAQKTGTSWMYSLSGTSFDLYHVWGASPDNVFIVGENGTFLTSSVASPNASVVSTSASSLQSNGSSTATISVALGLPGGEGFLPVTEGGDSVIVSSNIGTLGVLTDNDDGTYTTTFTAPLTFGTATISAAANGRSISDQATIVMTADTSTSTITASPLELPATGSSSSLITVQLKDGAGNNATTGGESLVLVAHTGNLAVTDNNDGTYSATLSPNGIAARARIVGILNGAQMANFVDVFLNTEPGQWTQVEDMNTARRDLTATTLDDGNVVIVGGTAVGLEQFFDPPNYQFYSDFNTPANHGSGLTVTKLKDGRVLIVGGTGTPTLAEIYDPFTRFFTPTGTVNSARIYHTATVLSDTTVLIVGGESPTTTTATAEIYNTNTGQFTPTTGNLNTGRSVHGAALLEDGRVLIVGGRSIDAVPNVVQLNSSETFDPVTELFSPGPTSQTAGYRHLFALPNNRALAFGAPFDTAAETFETGEGDFFSGAGFTQNEVFSAAVTALPNGDVLITGGISEGPTNAFQVYSASFDFFFQMPGMIFSRQQHAITVLNDGRIFVTGGFDGADLSSAEIWEGAITPPLAGPPRN